MGSRRQRPSGALDRDSGQAIVETAIMMPLYVFLLLGIMQLGLLHQARLMTKYAAYKAVRVGALNHGDVRKMEQTALAVLLPLVSYTNGSTGGEIIRPVVDDRTGADSASAYLMKWPRFMVNLDTAGFMKIAEVSICGPTQAEVGGNELDFDDPAKNGGDRTKLRVQVTFTYRMPILFANWFIHAMLYGREVTSVMRMGEGGATRWRGLDRWGMMSAQGVYAVPLRASYAMRMHSNLYSGNLPSRNACVVPFR